MEKVKFIEQRSYEARLSVREWLNGSGYSTDYDVVESWEIKSASDLEWWIKGVNSSDTSVYDYVTDNTEVLSDGDESDNEWKMEVIETDEDDNEKVLAVASIWESELCE